MTANGRLKLVHEGVVYRNPHPGHKAECAFLPNMLPLSDKEILCFCRIGQAFYSVDGRIAQFRSQDQGRAWDIDRQLILWDALGQEMLGVLHTVSGPSAHDNIAFGRPNLARLHDNTVICAWWCTQKCVTHSRCAVLQIAN